MDKKRTTLEQKIEEYFAGCQAAGNYPTVTGLALALGMDGRGELKRRAAKESKTGALLRRACSLVEEANLQAAYRRDSASGARFILQSGFGYGEKGEAPAGLGEITVHIIGEEG